MKILLLILLPVLLLAQYRVRVVDLPDSLQDIKSMATIRSEIKDSLDYAMTKENSIVNVRWFGADPSNSATDNSTAIYNACDYARNHNAILYFPRGTYIINRPIIINWDKGGIIGDGIKTTTIKRDATLLDKNSPSPNSTAGGIVVRFGYSGGLFRDFTVNANYSVNSGSVGTSNPILVDSVNTFSVIRVESAKITGHTYGIWIRNSQNITVDNCIVFGDEEDVYSPSGYENSQEGIEVSQGECDNIKVTNNYVYDISNNGIYAYTDQGNQASGNGYVINMTVDNNKVINCNNAIYATVTGSPSSTGIQNFIASNNKIDSCGVGVTLKVEGSVWTSLGYIFNNSTISGNKINYCGKSIALTYTDEVEIIKNELINDTLSVSETASCIDISASYDINIANNKILNMPNAGLSLSSGAHNVKIKNNHIEGAYYDGIYLNTYYNAIVKDNVIINCNTSGDTTSSQYYHCGIGSTNTDSVTITGNIIIDTRNPKLHRAGI